MRHRLARPRPRAVPPATRAADALETPEGWAAWGEHARAIRAAGGIVRASNGALYVTGYRDLRAILRDETTFSSSPLLDLDPVLLGTDGEAHRRVRQPLAAAFSVPALAGYESRIREVAAETLRAMAERGEPDLITGFATPFTLRMTWDLLGFEAYPVDRLVRWSRLIDYETTEEGSEEGSDPEAAASFQDVVATLYARTTEGTASGALAALAGVSPAMASPEAFASVLRALLVAGTVTTRDLIGNAVLALLRHPEAEAEVREDRSRLGAFLEEVFRLEAPVQRVLRRTTRRAEVGGQTVEADTLIVGLLGAANRDPAVFDAPDAFRMDRPQRALSFGYGPHSCIGRYWAMREATGALDVILDAWPMLESALPPDAVAMTPFTARGPVRLPLVGSPVGPGALVSAAP